MSFSEGTVALVTGASGGIGSATAIALARRCATVLVHYNTNAEGAKAILEQLGTTVQTSFERPGAAKGKQPPANTKKGK